MKFLKRIKRILQVSSSLIVESYVFVISHTRIKSLQSFAIWSKSATIACALFKSITLSKFLCRSVNHVYSLLERPLYIISANAPISAQFISKSIIWTDWFFPFPHHRQLSIVAILISTINECHVPTVVWETPNMPTNARIRQLFHQFNSLIYFFWPICT